jgi:hypothetical protein
MYLKKMAILSNDKYRSYYVNNSGEHVEEKLDNIKKLKPLFFCINDTETDMHRRKKLPKIMLEFFNDYYPRKPPFEK